MSREEHNSQPPGKNYWRQIPAPVQKMHANSRGCRGGGMGNDRIDSCIMRNEKQRNGKKIFIKGEDNTSFIVNRIFCK